METIELRDGDLLHLAVLCAPEPIFFCEKLEVFTDCPELIILTPQVYRKILKPTIWNRISHLFGGHRKIGRNVRHI